MPVVSVILAFHRVTPYFRPAVQSILGQTFADFELLLVDNGTGLGVSTLGEEGRDPRIRLIGFPENRGIAAAHNAAVAAARGEFIALMDYDDIALSQRFARQVEGLRDDPRLGLLFTHALAIDASGLALEAQFTLEREAEHRAFGDYAMPATPPTLMGRRELFAEYPMRPEFRVAPDYDLFTRAIERWRTRALPEVLLHYRRHPDQTSERAHALQVQNISRVRLLTARRRAGRPETAGPLAQEFGGWPENAPPPGETYAEFTRRAREEDFPRLAVYFARKLLSVRRDPAALQLALGTVAWALGRASGQRTALLRLFLTGPLHAHGLRPL